MNTTNKRILVIDDEPGIQGDLRAALNGSGFEISEVATGDEALSLARTSNFAAVLLDISMLGIGGFQTCRRLRRFSARIPIFAVSVRASEDDKVQALEAGADDYLTKPFNPRELIARLSASIRRAQLTDGSPAKAVLVIGEIELDLERHLLLKAGRRIHLTPKEFGLLWFLMENAGKTVPHESLLQSVWGIECQGELEYLRTFMRQIRKKIEDDPGRPRYLLTDAHIGYRFAAEVQGPRNRS